MDIDGLLHMLSTMYWWSVAAFSSGLWNIPMPLKQVLDGRIVHMHIQDRRIVQTTVAAQTATREEIRAHVAPDVSPRIIGNHLLAVGLRSRVPLVRLPLISRHSQAQLLWCHERVDWRMEWRSVVFSDENRFCLYASDECTHVWHKPGERHHPKCIRPRHTGPNSGFMLQLTATCGVSSL